MPTAAQKPGPATAADLLAIPEEQRFHEIIDGELVQKAVPSFEHGDAQSAIVAHVKLPFQRRPGGRWPGGWWFATEVEVELAPDQVYRPDVVGWRQERSPERPSGSPVRLRPDWVCEVLSPSNARHDTVKKMRAYQRCQLPHYWIVDPREETLTVYRWTPEGYLVALRAERGERVRAEPFGAIELQVGVLFGDEREDE
ncbi:Uma2 family endonuclease [Sorangium sp. So ce1182]|uniref:Uma2 family endonuclease n=1 Tax=Sorangium sp. So ce1182 TaxID=3133334 RepID=UPI003F5EA446